MVERKEAQNLTDYSTVFGFGKSFSASGINHNAFWITDDDIIICDLSGMIGSVHKFNGSGW